MDQSKRFFRRAGRSGALTLLLGVLVACATPPMELERARSTYEQAAGDPALASHASVELYEAGKSLDQAAAAWNLRRDAEETQHLAYLTERRVEIARAASERKLAEAQVTQLGEQRERVILEARTREADSMRARAEARAREAAERASEAEAARRDAEAAMQEALAAQKEAEQRTQEANLARQAADAAQKRVEELQRAIDELGARETDRGLVLTLGDVLFDLNKADLKPGSLRNLYRLASFLKQYPDRNVVVEGHTDSTGEVSYNLDLSSRRAAAVSNFLAENGIDSSRMRMQGYGETYPVASNQSASGRQRNRRVEVVILQPGESPDEKLRAMPQVGSPPPR